MTPPTSRRERPAKPALTRDGIVAAAVAVLRREGLATLTMRRLAQELDTGAASLYVYVRNTAELHAAILDELLGSVELRPEATDWRARLERILIGYTNVLFSYPGLAQSALVSRPSGPRYLALLEAVLQGLHDGGVPGDRAAWGADLLLQLATATAAEQATRDAALDTDDEDSALADAIRTADPATYPRIAALGDDLLSGPGEARLSYAFQAVFTGLLGTERPETPQN